MTSKLLISVGFICLGFGVILLKLVEYIRNPEMVLFCGIVAALGTSFVQLNMVNQISKNCESELQVFEHPESVARLICVFYLVFRVSRMGFYIHPFLRNASFESVFLNIFVGVGLCVSVLYELNRREFIWVLKVKDSLKFIFKKKSFSSFSKEIELA